MKKIIAIEFLLTIGFSAYAMEKQEGATDQPAKVSDSCTPTRFASEKLDLFLQIQNLLALELLQLEQRRELAPSSSISQWGANSREFTSEMDKGADCMTDGLLKMINGGDGKEEMKKGYETREHALKKRKDYLRNLVEKGGIVKQRCKSKTLHVPVAAALSLIGH